MAHRRPTTDLFSASISTSTPTSTPPPETIWYLAYGSNMSPKVLTESRKIHPLETKRVRVPGYWLSMDLGGIPFSEPCFASILKMDRSRMRERDYAEEVHRRCRVGQVFVWNDDDELEADGDREDGGKRREEESYPPMLHGVVYRITMEDWDLIVHSEGGWGHDVPIGYDTTHIPCMVYDTHEQISARVLLARPKSLHPNGQPSLRYKNLLTAGAQYHNLDPAYQASLARIVPYSCTSPKAQQARKVFRVFNLPLEWTFKMIIRLNIARESKKDGEEEEGQRQPPYWMAWLFDKTFRFSRLMHDWVLVPVVGCSGRCLEEGEIVVERRRIEEELMLKEKKRVGDVGGGAVVVGSGGEATEE
ncbi:hypothetical protein BGW39_009531 [Mortierella sp. 14UC]|nr:hypothetical protein BGW39_009531 [Mortierella sp. 14UC]